MPRRKRTYRYRVVDVFTDKPLEGNPLAVFPDASGIDDATMQRIARELNLSETAFLLPSTRRGCVVRARIFTPARELPFAGHPTVGSSFVALDEGLIPSGRTEFSLDEKVGPVAIRVERGNRPLIWLTTPPITFGRTHDPGLCAKAVGLGTADLLSPLPQTVSAGNPFIFFAVKGKPAVDRAEADSAALAALGKGVEDPHVGVFFFAPTPEGAYSRMFAPEAGVSEDPATGSATGPLAAYMLKHGLISGTAGTRFHSEQGTKMGRRSILHVHLRGEQGNDGIEVGGYVAPVIEARLIL